MKTKRARELQDAYFHALTKASVSPVARVLDQLALADLIRVEINVPQDGTEHSQHVWECCENTRTAATPMKANYWLRRAMVYAKDFMLWDDAIKGERALAGASAGGKKGALARRRSAAFEPKAVIDRAREMGWPSIKDPGGAGKLAAKFHVTPSWIRQILNAELKKTKA